LVPRVLAPIGTEVSCMCTKAIMIEPLLFFNEAIRLDPNNALRLLQSRKTEAEYQRCERQCGYRESEAAESFSLLMKPELALQERRDPSNPRVLLRCGA